MNKKLLGERIRKFRKRKKLTQAQLAENVKLATKHISNIEVGKTFPSLSKLEIIAKELDVELQDLFNFVSSKSRNEMINEINEIIKSPDDKDLRIAYKIIKDIYG